MIHLYKLDVVKFIISLISFIQLLIYYLIEVSLITFVVTSFGKGFFFFGFYFFLKSANYKMKIMDFCYKKNYDIKH